MNREVTSRQSLSAQTRSDSGRKKSILRLATTSVIIPKRLLTLDSSMRHSLCLRSKKGGKWHEFRPCDLMGFCGNDNSHVANERMPRLGSNTNGSSLHAGRYVYGQSR